MAGCQNCGPFLGTLNIRCRIIIGTRKGTTIMTTTHVQSVSIQGVGLLRLGSLRSVFELERSWRARP